MEGLGGLGFGGFPGFRGFKGVGGLGAWGVWAFAFSVLIDCHSVPLGFRIEGFLVAQCFWRAGSQELLMT